MAHTKQTPRNPVLERPSAAVGSNVQERRIPSKPSTKKITKGGKQPRKHLLRKMLKHNSVTGGIKKPHRYCIWDCWLYVRFKDTNNLQKVL